MGDASWPTPKMVAYSDKAGAIKFRSIVIREFFELDEGLARRWIFASFGQERSSAFEFYL